MNTILSVLFTIAVGSFAFITFVLAHNDRGNKWYISYVGNAKSQ